MVHPSIVYSFKNKETIPLIFGVSAICQLKEERQVLFFLMFFVVLDFFNVATVTVANFLVKFPVVWLSFWWRRGEKLFFVQEFVVWRYLFF